MPEYLAPGVYVEEVSFRSKLIEGVSTSTAGFVGPARYGPVGGMPLLITSFAEYERTFGTRDQLAFKNEDPSHNFLAHAVQSFFENGGRRVYIARIYKQDGTSAGTASSEMTSPLVTGGVLRLEARFPGAAGNIRVSFMFRLSKNVLQTDPDNPSVHVLRGVAPNDVLHVDSATTPTDSGLYYAERVFDETANRTSWRLYAGTKVLDLRDGDLNLAAGDRVRLLGLTVEAISFDSEGVAVHRDVWDNVAIHPDHRRALTRLFARELGSPSQEAQI